MPARIKPEWAPHKTIWTAWVSHPDLWLDDTDDAREQIAAMALALAEGEGAEAVKMLAYGDEAVATARAALMGSSVEVVPAAFGDVWVRDTGPVFGTDEAGKPLALRFDFNGWGGRYDLPHDKEIGETIANLSGTALRQHDFVLEGGSLDFDGTGNLLTTRQCLLNPNRNPGLSEKDIEAKLRDAFEIERICWIDEGLLNDHTDGHIDNIARFIAPGRVVCQEAANEEDPNAKVYDAIARQLEGAGFDVARIPSPGFVSMEDGKFDCSNGDPAPASHMNFIIGNKTVVMPIYNEETGVRALEALGPLFEGRRVLGIPSDAILLGGGGSFHCITQQEPA